MFSIIKLFHNLGIFYIPVSQDNIFVTLLQLPEAHSYLYCLTQALLQYDNFMALLYICVCVITVVHVNCMHAHCSLL